MKKIQNRQIIICSGEDCEQFLQGIVTNNVKECNELMYCLILTPQGKLLHDLFIYKQTDRSFVLDCYTPATDDILTLFNKFKLGSKVTFYVDDKMNVYSSKSEGFRDPRHSSFENRMYSKEEFDVEVSDDTDAHYQLSLPRLYIDFKSGDYFPFEVGFDQFNAISHTKGCYIGQEVITRTHFRGVIRKKVYQVKLYGDVQDISSTPLNTELFSGEQKVGTLLGTYGKIDGYTKGLALLKSELSNNVQFNSYDQSIKCMN